MTPQGRCRAKTHPPTVTRSPPATATPDRRLRPLPLTPPAEPADPRGNRSAPTTFPSLPPARPPEAVVLLKSSAVEGSKIAVISGYMTSASPLRYPSAAGWGLLPTPVRELLPGALPARVQGPLPARAYGRRCTRPTEAPYRPAPSDGCYRPASPRRNPTGSCSVGTADHPWYRLRDPSTRSGCRG